MPKPGPEAGKFYLSQVEPKSTCARVKQETTAVYVVIK